MFYGSGAGKLPTASAVVADVVDAAKHVDTNIMTIWDPNKMILGDKSEFACKFFVREKDTVDAEQRKAVFGDVKFVTVDGVSGEYAFLTDVMKESVFEEKIQKFDLIYRIRTTF